MSKIVSNVEVIGQYPVLPTGCEATALTMLLRWAGVEVEKETVADALVKEPNPFEQEGKLLGGNPYRAFIGDPYDKESYGTFHGPIAQTLEKFLPGRALDLTGLSFEELLLEIDRERPVVVWATIELKEPRKTTLWEDIDGSGTMIQWQSPEHCMTLVGYSEEFVIINDPHTGNQEHYPRDLFRLRWEQLGQQAVTVK
ncbi:C39 family peptidase [Tumebacillus sp. ITR2]|uniref:C39 family peptidase n=1 Tax=Tumebacillus amylolyticus TaxID=2801339 RepID=A0ABS1JE08_9BACL|nr:C39 family peptidase [Tumebacillus amylolyticus]MBL0388516.1 C39 family peptidase [Tumebacillus amylolyticus]